MSANRIARIAAIAALYAAATLLTNVFMGWLSWGPIQFRVSEALCVLALFTPDAIIGLTLGCVIANIVNVGLSGFGTLGLLDVVFGSLATAIGAYLTWHMHQSPKVAILGPVVSNGVIVPAYLPLMLQGMGFYTIPFTTIALDGAFLPMYLFGLVTTSFGEAVVMYVLGLPLYRALEHTPLPAMLAGEDDVLSAREKDALR